jgi:hypothetical protein
MYAMTSSAYVIKNFCFSCEVVDQRHPLKTRRKMDATIAHAINISPKWSAWGLDLRVTIVVPKQIYKLP